MELSSPKSRARTGKTGGTSTMNKYFPFRAASSNARLMLLGRWKQYHRLTPRCNFAARAGHGKAKRLWIKCFHLNLLFGPPEPSSRPMLKLQTHRAIPDGVWPHTLAARAAHGNAKRLWIKCFHLRHLLSASRVIGAPPPSPLPPSDAQTPTAPSNSRRCVATAVENTYEFNVSSFGQLWGARHDVFLFLVVVWVLTSPTA